MEADRRGKPRAGMEKWPEAASKPGERGKARSRSQGVRTGAVPGGSHMTGHAEENGEWLRWLVVWGQKQEEGGELLQERLGSECRNSRGFFNDDHHGAVF